MPGKRGSLALIRTAITRKSTSRFRFEDYIQIGQINMARPFCCFCIQDWRWIWRNLKTVPCTLLIDQILHIENKEISTLFEFRYTDVGRNLATTFSCTLQFNRSTISYKHKPPLTYHMYKCTHRKYPWSLKTPVDCFRFELEKQSELSEIATKRTKLELAPDLNRSFVDGGQNYISFSGSRWLHNVFVSEETPF